MPSGSRSYFWRDGDPLWYKDAVIYETHVRAFFDHTGDGIGDFGGLTEKLDYLYDLGVTAIWLLPFYPSPLKDDGYDVSDYTSIHPNYGTIQDFKTLLREANYRGLRVITELVVNHTSDQHAWFQRARHAEPGSPGRDFYVWSDTPNKFKEARIIFKDFETSNWTWDNVAKAYYWHRFYSHQPDLNYDNPHVQQAIFRVLDFWLDMGVSGLRLDAVPYLYEREGTNCENLPETHEFLKKLRQHVDSKYANRMLISEANQWSEDAVAYFGSGDESHLAFNFPLMPRMFMAIRMEDRFPIIDIMNNTPAIPDNCQWALFLRNHDELTLEMVTDEERDYMYRMYAYDSQARINLGIRRRLAPLLNNDRKKIELMNAILFSLPGTPIVYYGDEIGMGDNFYLGDRNGVRTPMQWSGDRNAGFSRANPQRLYLPVNIDPEYHYEAVNVEVQQNNSESLLWWMRRIISLRKRFSAFGRGSIEFLQPDNRKVLAFIRRYENETILVVANLSRSVQHASLDLNEFNGRVPTEIFGQTEFPVIGETPYFLTMSPYAFYWFSIEPSKVALVTSEQAALDDELPSLNLSGEWTDLYKRRLKSQMQQALLDYVKKKRWYGGKTRRADSLTVEDYVIVPYGKQTAHLLITRLEYTEGEPDYYLLPVTFTQGEDVDRVLGESPNYAVARLNLRNRNGDDSGLVYEAIVEEGFRNNLFRAMMRRRRVKSDKGEMVSSNLGRAVLNRVGGSVKEVPDSVIMPGEQSNTSVSYGNKFKLKLFRHLEEGLSPELEIGRFLTTKQAFGNVPPVIGALEYHGRRMAEPLTLGVMHGFTANEGDGWHYTLDSLGRFYEVVLERSNVEIPLPSGNSPVDDLDTEIPPVIEETIGAYLASVQLLAQRTAELHIALASDIGDPAFVPEPFSLAYQRSLSHSMRGFGTRVLQLLKRRLRQLPEDAREDARKVLDYEPLIMQNFQNLIGHRISGVRIRCHGDYHLGQVLYTGNDFVITDFEGEPARRLGERRIKRSPLRDVAGMIRSFHYCSYAALSGQVSTVLRPEDMLVLDNWSLAWHQWVSVVFLKHYIGMMRDLPVLPQSRDGLRMILNAYLFEKALYEVDYELNNRPDWVGLPLQGILNLLAAEDGTGK